MNVVISHTNTDFDSLAAMVAARKLYPDATLVLTGSPDQSVKDFLAIHKSWIQVCSTKEVDSRAVRRVILVDTRDGERIGEFRDLVNTPGVELHIYDHHPPSYRDLVGEVNVVREVGSTTTILVQLIQEKGIPITPLEATLFSAGIYVDTGSFTFATSTDEDLEAAAFLYRNGANIGLVSDQIYHTLSEDQRGLLNQLLVSSQYFHLHGFTLLITTATVDRYIDELALLTHKLIDLERIDGAFSVVRMKDRIYMVGRSKTPAIDVAEILAQFGGGGHSTAASCAIKGHDLQGAKERLWKVIQKKVSPLMSAEDMMTTLVHTVDPSTTVEQARLLLLQYGHSSLPVVEKGKLVGILTRKDLDKAHHHRYGHAPVKAYMSRELIVASAKTPLADLQRMMTEHDIGRIPIVDHGSLAGIVTRADILRVLGLEKLKRPILSSHLRIEDLSHLPERILEILRTAGKVGEEKGLGVFVVGGFVRDLLLGVENFDLDFVVEGDAISFAHLLAEKLYGRVKAHEKFGTAVVILRDGFKIDLATARAELYARPAAMPDVAGTSIKQDLRRRDFTINTLAMKLNPVEFGMLIDFFGGQRDLQHGVVRILHNLSFVEDPTRIFRGVRFEQRYHFRMDSNTERLLKGAIVSGVFEEVAHERVRDEMILILSESNPLPALKRMERLRMFPLLHSRLHLDSGTLELLHRVQQGLNQFHDILEAEGGRPWLIYFLALTEPLAQKEIEALGSKLKLTARDQEILCFDRQEGSRILKILNAKQAPPPSSLVGMLKEFPLEVVLYLYGAARGSVVKERLASYILNFRSIPPLIRGKDLAFLGFSPGPAYREVLEAVRAAQLDGKVQTKEEAMEMAKKHWEALHSVPEGGQPVGR